MIGPAAAFLGALAMAAVDSSGEASLPATVALEDVYRLVRERSPRSLAERTQIDVAGAEVRAARAYPNPSFDFNGSYLNGGTNTGAAIANDYSVEVPLLLFGQRRERLKAAELGTRLAEARVAVGLEERIRAARDLFVNLLARQERVRLLEEARDDLRRIAHLIEGRASAGDKSRYDALKIEVEARSTEADLAEARAETRDVSGKLAALLGFPGWEPEAKGDLQPDPGIDPADEEALWRETQEHRATIESARRARILADQATALALRERLPTPVLMGGWATTRNAQSRSTLAGLSVPLPLFDRGQGPIARATAGERAAERELEAVTAEARADLERACAVLTKRREALQTFERDVMARLPELRTMAEAAYREGQSAVLDLLDSFRSMTGNKLAHLDALEAAKLAESDLLFQEGRVEGR